MSTTVDEQPKKLIKFGDCLGDMHYYTPVDLRRVLTALRDNRESTDVPPELKRIAQTVTAVRQYITVETENATAVLQLLMPPDSRAVHNKYLYVLDCTREGHFVLGYQYDGKRLYLITVDLNFNAFNADSLFTIFEQTRDQCQDQQQQQQYNAVMALLCEINLDSFQNYLYDRKIAEEDKNHVNGMLHKLLAIVSGDDTCQK